MARHAPRDSEVEVAADKLRRMVSEIEASDDRIDSENRHKSEIYKNAKKDGFNVKALRKVIAARRMDDTVRATLDADFDLYMMHLEGVTHAHEEIIDEFDAETGEIIEPHTAPSPQVVQADHGGESEAPQALAAGQIQLPVAAAQTVTAHEPVAGTSQAGGDAVETPVLISEPGNGQAGEKPVSAGAQLEGESILASGGDAANSSSNVTAFTPKPLRPWCQQAHDLTKCGGYGRVHCSVCQKLKDAGHEPGIAVEAGGVQVKHHGAVS